MKLKLDRNAKIKIILILTVIVAAPFFAPFAIDVATRVSCCSSELLELIADGELIFGYNILSSYAMDFVTKDPRVGVIFPEDYTLTISRVAFIHKDSLHLDNAQTFLRYLLSPEGQQVIASEGGLLAIHPDVNGPFTLSALKDAGNSINFHNIDQGPPLLIYLDQSKRQIFIKEWEDALLLSQQPDLISLAFCSPREHKCS